MASVIRFPSKKVNRERFRYSTGLRGGIFDPKHFNKIGLALWTFAWSVHRQTHRDGRVAGGKPLTYQDIADEVGLPSAETARHHIRILVAGKYLRRETVHGAGIRLWVEAPKKTYRTPAVAAGTPAVAADHPGGSRRSPLQSPYKETDLEREERTPLPLSEQGTSDEGKDLPKTLPSKTSEKPTEEERPTNMGSSPYVTPPTFDVAAKIDSFRRVVAEHASVGLAGLIERWISTKWNSWYEQRLLFHDILRDGSKSVATTWVQELDVRFLSGEPLDPRKTLEDLHQRHCRDLSKRRVVR